MSLVLRPPIKAAGLGCALSVLALVEHRATGDSWWAAAAGVAVVGVVVAIRSTGPLLAWAAAVALLGVTWTLTGGRVCVYQLALVAVASWWAGRASGDARALGAMLGVGATAVAVIVAAPRGGSSVGESLGTGLVLFANLLVLAAVPWLFGLRFSRAEASHRSSINEARARERRRIAREMHDSLGHELSLITLRAGALEVARGLDDRHRASAAALREAAGSATERLSEIVGLLPGDGQAPPSPGTETLRDLVDRARDSGLPVAFERDRPEVVAGMTPVGRRAVHRIVQESLTNAAKHAPGAAVEVRLDPRPGWLRVVVANERPSRPGARERPRSRRSRRTRPRRGRDAERRSHRRGRLRRRSRSAAAERRNAVVRVLIADDERGVRAAVKDILESAEGIEVVAEAVDGRSAVEAVRRHRPRVVLLDIQMPGADGLAAAEEIGRSHPGTAVLILTTFSDDAFIARALRAGASGFLLKSGAPGELVAGVRAASEGEAYLSPRVARRVISELGPGERMSRAVEARARVAALTDREREVLALVGAGLTNGEIARRLYLVEGTVKAYLRTAFTRLGVSNRVQAAVLAHESGLVREG